MNKVFDDNFQLIPLTDEAAEEQKKSVPTVQTFTNENFGTLRSIIKDN